MVSENMRLVSQSTAEPMLMPMLRVLVDEVVAVGELLNLALQLVISVSVNPLIRAITTFLIIQFGSNFI